VRRLAHDGRALAPERPAPSIEGSETSMGRITRSICRAKRSIAVLKVKATRAARRRHSCRRLA
jgi:hypothetical protein